MEPQVGQWLVTLLASEVQLTQFKHWQCCTVVDGATGRPVTSGQWCWGRSGLCWSWLYHSDCCCQVKYSWRTVKTLTVLLHNGGWLQPGSLSHRTASFYPEWIGQLKWPAHFNTDTDSAPCGRAHRFSCPSHPRLVLPGWQDVKMGLLTSSPMVSFCSLL